MLVVTVLIGGCSGDVSEETTPSSTVAMVQPSSTSNTALSRCNDAIAESISTFDVMLDRIDANPQEVDSAALADMSGELGELVGGACTEDEKGEAFSELVVYLADQANRRTRGSQTFINGFLSGLCEDSPVELTRQARATCVTDQSISSSTSPAEPTCNKYLATFRSEMSSLLPILTDAQAAVRGVVAGVADRATADQLFVLSDRLSQIAEQVRSLGEAPAPLAEGIRLVLNGLDRYAESYEITSRVIRNGDLDLAEAVALKEEADLLLVEGLDKLSCLPLTLVP